MRFARLAYRGLTPLQYGGPEPQTLLSPEKAIRLPLPPGEPFDPQSTFRCGQIFRWNRHGDTWYGPYREGSLAVRLAGDAVEVRALGTAVSAGEAWRFLGLDMSLQAVYRALAFDRWVRAAAAAYPGLRILRQDPWDCVAGYICSQWNNIPKIELSTGRIGRSWGTMCHWPEGVEIAAFPAPATLAQRTASELRESALGYRCAYLVDAAQMIARCEIDLASLRGLPYSEALRTILRLPGVGRKVADCILLFSLDQPLACPVDVWVRRVIHELYPRQLSGYLPDARQRAEKGLSTREYDAILRFAWDRWGVLAGYAQQYLFHARRKDTIGPDATAAPGPQKQLE